MLDWTGERFVPWAKEAAVAYEHLHRYAWASDLVKDKCVLDLASGEGYGSNMLASQAASVVGVDLDEQAVRHAAEKYPRSNLRFAQGSITEVPISDDHSFDVIVCFEAIEHIEEHEELLGEVKRLLKSDGLFLISTPNKAVYTTDGTGESNPFHLKELSFEEFNALLLRYFAQVKYLGQSVHPVSNMWPIGSVNGVLVREFPVERREAEFQPISNDQRVATYFIGIASDAGAPVPHTGSVLVDHSNELVNDANQKDRELADKDRELVETKASAEEAIRWKEAQLRNQEIELRQRQEALTWRESQVAELTKDLEWSQDHVRDLEATLSSQDEALKWRAHQVEDLQKEKDEIVSNLQGTQHQLGLTQERLQAIEQSRGWKAVLKLRRLLRR